MEFQNQLQEVKTTLTPSMSLRAMNSQKDKQPFEAFPLGVVERESIATTDSSVESKTDSPLRIELNWKVLPQPDN